MIIISQDKKQIINFDNVTQIYISDCEGYDTGYFIRFGAVDSSYDDLGEYATEKRAKEVLREIIEFIRAKSNILMDAEGIKTEFTGNIYEMPEK